MEEGGRGSPGNLNRHACRESLLSVEPGAEYVTSYRDVYQLFKREEQIAIFRSRLEAEGPLSRPELAYVSCERRTESHLGRAGQALYLGLSRCRVRSSRLQMNAVSGCNAYGGAPCLEGLGAEPTLRCRRDEMATDVESIVDRGMCRKESLSRSG
jgi:hypothetical protein